MSSAGATTASGDSPSLPSPLFSHNLARLREAARLGPILDLACGRGRHSLAAAEAGLPVIGLDRSRASLEAFGSGAPGSGLSSPAVPRVHTDLETAFGLPIRPASCGAILVFRFLHRPLAAAITAALAPGGLLLYETFTKARASLKVGPSNPLFLLDAGELRGLFPELQVLGYEEPTRIDRGRGDEGSARLVARKPL